METQDLPVSLGCGSRHTVQKPTRAVENICGQYGRFSEEAKSAVFDLRDQPNWWVSNESVKEKKSKSFGKKTLSPHPIGIYFPYW